MEETARFIVIEGSNVSQDETRGFVWYRGLVMVRAAAEWGGMKTNGAKRVLGGIKIKVGSDVVFYSVVQNSTTFDKRHAAYVVLVCYAEK